MSLTKCERSLIVSWLANAATRLRRDEPEALDLARFVVDNRRLLGVGKLPSRPRASRRKSVRRAQWRQLCDALAGARPPASRSRGDLISKRLRKLGSELDLSKTDQEILNFLLRYRLQPIFEDMVDSVFCGRASLYSPFNMRSQAIPYLLDIPASDVRERVAAEAPLVKSGLVRVDDDGDLGLAVRLRRLGKPARGAGREVCRLLFDEAPRSDLEWADFDHVSEDRDQVERTLRGALETRAPGVNILLYGPPGTGKTEFCRVLADRLGVALYSIGEADQQGREPRRDERLQELRLAQGLLARSGSLLLFDEMEDLLESDPVFLLFGAGKPGAGGSKVFLNRLMERNPAPTLWTSNTARNTCPTLLRRMMFALELRRPSPRVRARVWSRQLAHHGIEAGEGEVRALAAEFEVTPGVVSEATAAARLAGGDLETVRRNVRSLGRVMGCDRPPQRTPERFDPALIQADANPVRLAERLARSDARKRFSLCLEGPPGTGKSAFVRHLAERIGLEVVQKRTSDLLSKWLGETEQKIAAAFAEARAERAFLVFDEADSLLADRRFAVRSWEVSQVNEMLTWMESHPLPFACTTNFGDHLDSATLRRFDFKITLDYLTPEQAMAAFRTYFDLPPPPEVARLPVLTPGDFPVVRRRAEIMGSLEDPQELAAMLRAECEAKPHHSGRIGFRRPARTA